MTSTLSQAHYAASFGISRSTNRRNRWLRALATNLHQKTFLFQSVKAVESGATFDGLIKSMTYRRRCKSQVLIPQPLKMRASAFHAHSASRPLCGSTSASPCTTNAVKADARASLRTRHSSDCWSRSRRYQRGGLRQVCNGSGGRRSNCGSRAKRVEPLSRASTPKRQSIQGIGYE